MKDSLREKMLRRFSKKRREADIGTIEALNRANTELQKERDDYAQQLNEMLDLLKSTRSVQALTAISVRQLDALGLGILLSCDKVRQ